MSVGAGSWMERLPGGGGPLTRGRGQVEGGDGAPPGRAAGGWKGLAPQGGRPGTRRGRGGRAWLGGASGHRKQDRRWRPRGILGRGKQALGPEKRAGPGYF